MLGQHQQQIQEIAYYLWVSEGKPDGQSERHWQIASRMAEEEVKGQQKRSVDPCEVKNGFEPAQPDQT